MSYDIYIYLLSWAVGVPLLILAAAGMARREKRDREAMGTCMTRCACGHFEDDHNHEAQQPLDCDVPGCGCRAFDPTVGRPAPSSRGPTPR